MARDVALGKEQGFKGSDGMGWRASEQCFGEEEEPGDEYGTCHPQDLPERPSPAELCQSQALQNVLEGE